MFMTQSCDVVGCDRSASVTVSLTGLVRVAPRRTSADPVPLCERHASKVAEEMQRQIEEIIGPGNPNRNSSNRAMSSEDLGDAEDLS